MIVLCVGPLSVSGVVSFVEKVLCVCVLTEVGVYTDLLLFILHWADDTDESSKKLM